VIVRVSGGSTTIDNVPFAVVSPGIFETMEAGSTRKYAVAQRPDGSFVSPSNPARKGETIRIFATGIGQTSPGTLTNRAGAPGQRSLYPVIVGIGGGGVQTTTEYMPGIVGVFMISFTVPETMASSQSAGIVIGVEAPGGTVYSVDSNIAVQ
jgi:uncharacterized protein (TIGR03437 family)